VLFVKIREEIRGINIGVIRYIPISVTTFFGEEPSFSRRASTLQVRELRKLPNFPHYAL